jgi:hypothetical protein
MGSALSGVNWFILFEGEFGSVQLAELVTLDGAPALDGAFSVKGREEGVMERLMGMFLRVLRSWSELVNL